MWNDTSHEGTYRLIYIVDRLKVEWRHDENAMIRTKQERWHKNIAVALR